MDGNNVGVTSCETAAKFHYRYNHDHTTRKCYNCDNLFYIRKYPREKNLWLRFKRFLVQFADGQQLIPFISLLTSNKYLIQGFVILPVEGGEDRIECRECGEWTTVDEVDQLANISLGPPGMYEEELNQIAEERKERNKKLRNHFEESRTDEYITLPDGTHLNGRYVLIHKKMVSGPDKIDDVLEIMMGKRRIVANTLILSEEEQRYELLHSKEPRDSKLLQNYAMTEKEAFEDSLYQKYPPQSHRFETYPILPPIIYHRLAERTKKRGKELWDRIKP